jgi:peptidoglycan/xylan/chitin deacetylase (PgdA/CDA1 family)
MNDTAYAPARHLGAAIDRRRVQRHLARPARARLPRPVISFTFDDFPKSAVTRGAQILEAAGGRGTWYASCAYAGESTQYGPMFDAADVARLTAAGHEVGCHTFAHVDCARATADDVFADMVRNADALTAMGLEERLVSFAYPYGETSVALKDSLPARFTSARGTTPGLAHGRIDLAQLPANALFGDDAQKRALLLLEQARRRNAWVIFYAHDVSTRPTPWGASTGLLERVVTSAYATGIEIAPVRDVAARILAEGAA